jgi:hypothetical protein
MPRENAPASAVEADPHKEAELIASLVRTMILCATTTLVATALSGCATSGDAFAPAASAPDGKALIYVYRNGALHGAMFSPVVTLGNDIKIALSVSGYYPYVAPPGPILIRITNVGTRSFTLDAKAGETYYVRGGLIFMAAGFPALGQVPATEALAELKDCKRITKSMPVTAADLAQPAASAPAQ